jgi:maltooligosyltrehalose trehalohydrolase
MSKRVGATVEDGGTRFTVYAPVPRKIEVALMRAEGRRLVPMRATGGGYFEAFVPGVGHGARYGYVLDGDLLPDMASRSQPEGVHAPSEVLDYKALPLSQPPRPRSMREVVLYELHIGTFTQKGTFDAAARELGRLVELGVNAVEIMPVGSFPGRRNWGYDGVSWFAPQASYGGPAGLARLVDACHAAGLSIVLDVVYNHFGPEGNYMGRYASFFTHAHTTPWGDAIDFSQDPVRHFVLENARMWLEDYRFDGLRLDAVHAIFDDSPRHIVGEVAALAHDLGRFVIAESDLGEVAVIADDGWRCDAQWSDDFHHALHAAVTGERSGYYVDFGRVADVAKAIANGFVYEGQESRYRGRAFGTPSSALPGERFVVAAQNHDQVGNRARGERLAHVVPGCQHAVAATLVLAPQAPMLFMGEEHDEPAPCLYFTDHGDPPLGKAVTEGRRREHSHEDVPDPQAPSTHAQSIIDLSRGASSPLYRFYRQLLALRKTWRDVLHKDGVRTLVDEAAGGLCVIYKDTIAVAVSLQGRAVEFKLPDGNWRVALDAGEFGGRAGARLEGDRLWLPPFGALVLQELP